MDTKFRNFCDLSPLYRFQPLHVLDDNLFSTLENGCPIVQINYDESPDNDEDSVDNIEFDNVDTIWTTQKMRPCSLMICHLATGV